MFEEKQKLTKSLSKRYEKLLGNIGDEERAKVEGEIHKLISGSNLSKNERNTIKMKAKNIAKLNKNSINVSELHKFKNFKNTPSKKNFIDLNSSNIYNINNNLNSLEMEIDIPNQEEDLNNEMLSLSCEMLYSNGMINNSELGSLSETDKQKVIDYTKTLKEYSSLPEEEVARRMVLEPWVDPSGNLNRRDEVTPADIIAQMNINRMHNLMNRLSVFKENTNSDNEGKII